MAIRYIDPLKDLGPLLLTVEKPARYTGGEYGRLAKREAPFQTLIAFPDLYEIGMSNQAMRILYNRLNRMEGISCDRSFAPAPDFEVLLREQGIPLYGLDTGISLGSLDLLMFTLGYELGITCVLAMLDLGGIPLRAAERGREDPIVIMGGPCVSNPLPYAPFIDAFWIGEAEDGFFDLAGELGILKQGGAKRGELLERMLAHPSVWAAGKGRARRAIDRDFASRPAEAAVFPVASLKTVQHHGAVEIMRGCPNGCRFCHAGYWYRPMRQKSAALLREEAAAFIREGGYREISLSSLSTGDYCHIDGLVESLDREFSPLHVSFQLPSLKISTFSLALLEKVSRTRKSGLTFAVETPGAEGQGRINKAVSKEDVVSIIREARKNGWRGAKFYFMIGLPGLPEEQEIIDFILDTGRKTGMNFNVTVGAFVPKPHTPYQRMAQIDEGEAREKLDHIRQVLKSRGHRIGVQDPFISTLEGLVSRGDQRVGELVEAAYRRGCRLDAWSEYLRRDIWETLLAEQGALVREVLGEKTDDSPLPWDFIDSGVSSTYFRNEAHRSRCEEFTSSCIDKCTHPCGICNDRAGIVNNSIQYNNLPCDPGGSPVSPLTPPSVLGAVKNPEGPGVPDSFTYRILFSFTKQGTAVFQSHLSLMEIFSMALLRGGIPAHYSEGFNPMPCLEIVSPLAVGISSAGETAMVETDYPVPAGDFMRALESKLPEGIRITGALNIRIPRGHKKYSLSALLWGSAYSRPGEGEKTDMVKATEDKDYRRSLEGLLPERHSVLAQFPRGDDVGEPYFEVFRRLYP